MLKVCNFDYTNDKFVKNMRNTTRVLFAILVSALAFSSCKYEHGPGISLRTKRDRVSNEWLVSKFVYDGVDQTGLVNSDSNGFHTLLKFSRTGAYSVEMLLVMKDSATGGIKYLTTHTSNNSLFLKPGEMWDVNKKYSYINNLPSPIRFLGVSGSWAFEKGHYKIGVSSEKSYESSQIITEKNPIFWVITMLKEKEMHVRGNDQNGKEWTMEMKSINDEDYFY